MTGKINPKMKQNLNIKVVENEVMVYDPANEKIHVINQAAGEILNLCDGQNNPEIIKKKISDLYGLADRYEDICRDVDEILLAFNNLGILDPDEQPLDNRP
jgi:hypothetical protein